MRIGELARRSALSASRIRFYEAHGLLPRAERRDNGYRDYPESAVETLRLIHGAQDLGFSLAEIRGGLSQAGASLPSKGDMLVALRNKLVSLDQHIGEVSLRRARIVAWIEEFERELRSGQKKKARGVVRSTPRRDVRSTPRRDVRSTPRRDAPGPR